jgi:membrane-associated phospholipid phosphatase
MKLFYTASKAFIIPLIFMVIAGGIFIVLNSKGAEVLLLNKLSSPVLDKFFLFITDFGLGSVLAGIGAVLAVYRLRWAVLALATLSLTGVFTFVFKRIVFNSETRPLHYFLYADFERFLHDVPLIYYNSFPSGHTMAAFAFFSLMAFLSGKKASGVVFFGCAFLIGISRIYLLQHFGGDVIAGAVLGLTATFIAVMIFDGLLNLSGNGFFHKGVWHIVSGYSGNRRNKNRSAGASENHSAG